MKEIVFNHCKAFIKQLIVRCCISIIYPAYVRGEMYVIVSTNYFELPEKIMKSYESSYAYVHEQKYLTQLEQEGPLWNGSMEGEYKVKSILKNTSQVAPLLNRDCMTSPNKSGVHFNLNNSPMSAASQTDLRKYCRKDLYTDFRKLKYLTVPELITCYTGVDVIDIFNTSDDENDGGGGCQPVNAGQASSCQTPLKLTGQK